MWTAKGPPASCAPPRSTARSCRAGCGSTTRDMSPGRAGWQRQPCPTPVIYSQTLGPRRLTLTPRTGITAPSVLRSRPLRLRSPPGQVTPRWSLSRSSRRMETHRDQVNAAGFARTAGRPYACCRQPPGAARCRQDTLLQRQQSIAIVNTVSNVDEGSCTDYRTVTSIVQQVVTMVPTFGQHVLCRLQDTECTLALQVCVPETRLHNVRIIKTNDALI